MKDLRRALSAFAVAVLATGAACQEFDIGTQGAKVRLGREWSRQKLHPDLGKDQFAIKKQKGLFGVSTAYLVALEVRTPVESKADFERLFPLLVMQSQAAQTKYYDDVSPPRASREWADKLGNINLWYRLDIIAHEGLAYGVLSWAARSEAKLVAECADEFLGAFSAPGPNSEHQRGIEETRRSVTYKTHRIEYEHRPFVLAAQPPEDEQLAALLSDDEQHGAFILTQAAVSAERALTTSLSIVNDGHDDPFVELERRDVTINGVVGRRSIGKNATQTLHLLALPLGDGEFVDVRYLSPGAPEDPRYDRDLLLEGLQIRPLVAPIALPPIPDTPSLATKPSPARAAFREACRPLNKLDLYPTAARRLAADRWLAWSGGKAVAFGPTAVEEILNRDSWSDFDLVPFGDGWLIADYDQSVVAFRDGVEGAVQPFRARRLHPLGDDMLLVRGDEAPQLPGIAVTQRVGDLLVQRRTNGQERTIARLPDLIVDRFVVDRQGRHALLQCRLRSQWIDNARLLEVDLQSGDRRELGGWHALWLIAATDGGWLVSGAPRDGAPGIRHFATDASGKLLVTGADWLGIDFDGETLTLLDRNVPQGCDLLAAPKSAWESHGVRCGPFGASTLETIGAQLRKDSTTSTAPRTKEEILALLDRADEHARRLVGNDLPRSPEGVDELFAAVRSGIGLEASGRLLLVLLSTRALLDAGAVWVEPKTCEWMDWIAPATMPGESPFAVLQSPAQLVGAAIGDEEDAYGSCSWLLQGTDGRPILLGLDRASLRERAESLAVPGLNQAIERADAEALLRLLAGASEHLRAHVYQQLAVGNALPALATLAGHFAQTPNASRLDTVFWLSARLAVDPSSATAEAVATAALNAVQKDPAAVALYQILGAAYERTHPDELERARTCYRRVLQMENWGELATAAKAALQRLED
ncbi:MAG: hypothetical protein RL398_558 [Planctomycetota bacterium]